MADESNEELRLRHKNDSRFSKVSDRLHSAITDNNLDDIKEILDQNPGMRYFFDYGISALKYALQANALEVYELLLQRGLSFAPREKFPPKQKLGDKFCEINTKLSLKFCDQHIDVLVSKCRYPCNNRLTESQQKRMRMLLENANAIEELQPILEAAAAVKELRIFVDFDQPWIKYMDPAARATTNGQYDPKARQVLIGAAGIEDDFVLGEISAILVHELTHCVLREAFRNDGFPYAVDDVVNEKFFESILSECENLCGSNSEVVVKSVFEVYKGAAQKRELAVRVAHMVALYSKIDDNELLENRKIFKSLFDYHYRVVLPEIRAAVPVIEMIADDSSEISFEKLTEPLKAFVCHSDVKFQGKDLKLANILRSNTAEVAKAMTSKQLRDILGGKVLEIGAEEPKIDFYFERIFIDYDYRERVWYKGDELMYFAEISTRNFEQLVREVDKSKIFLLSDHAGTGKSTSLKFFSSKVKQLKSDFWVSFVDLKQYLKVFEKFEPDLKEAVEKSVENGDDVCNDVVVRILESILAIKDAFESKLFRQLFSEGRVILLLDAVDEISPKYKSFFVRFIKNVRNLTENQQWIATRPQHTDVLKNSFNCKAYRLLELNERQCLKFFHDYLKFNNFGQHETSKSTKILEYIIQKLKLANNILVLKILADLLMKKELPKDLDSNINGFDLYGKIVHKKKLIRNAKGEEVQKDVDNGQNLTVWRVHEVFAVKVLFDNQKFEDFLESSDSTDRQRNFVDFEEFRLFEDWNKAKSDWTADVLSRLGFLTVFNWNGEDEQPEFTHRTFAEYFFACFVIKEVKDVIQINNLKRYSESEFMLKMKLCAYLAYEYCKNYPGKVISFITDYLSTSKLAIGEIFCDFLKSKHVKTFILRILYEDDCRFSKLVDLMSNLFKEVKYDEAILKNALCELENKTLFELLIQRNEFEAAAKLLDSLISLNISNLSSFTGFELEISELHSSEHEMDDIDKLEKDPGGQFQYCRIMNQLLRFFIIATNKTGRSEFNSLTALFESHPLLVTGCRFLIDKLITISSRTSDTSEFNLRFKQIFISEISMHTNETMQAKLAENFEYFLRELSDTLDPNENDSNSLPKKSKLVETNDQIIERKTLREALYKMLANKTAMYLMLHQTISHRHFHCYKLLTECFTTLELQVTISSELSIQKLSQELFETFNSFCEENFDGRTLFRVFFNCCANFPHILRLFRAMKAFYSKNWYEHTKYEIKPYSLSLKVKDLINLDEVELDVKDLDAIDACELLAFVNDANIGVQEMRNFFRNNLRQIFEFSIETHENLVEIIFTCLEKFRNDDEIMEIVQNQVKSMKLELLRNFNQFTNFFANLEKLTPSFKNFLKIECSLNEISPLVIATALDFKDFTEIAKKHLEKTEIESILVSTDWFYVGKHFRLDPVLLASLGAFTDAGRLAWQTTVLMTKCLQPQSSYKDHQKALIRSMLLKIDSNAALRPILQVLAVSPPLTMKFHFSFASDYGRRNNRSIHVGAAGIECAAKFTTVSATLVHEMMHCVFDILYDNNCVPYAEEDEAMRSLFEEVVEDCRLTCEGGYDEEIVAVVFKNYHGRELRKELGVRVPQMLATYGESDEKLSANRKKFARLFGFYEDVIVPAMRANVAEAFDALISNLRRS